MRSTHLFIEYQWGLAHYYLEGLVAYANHVDTCADADCIILGYNPAGSYLLAVNTVN